MENSVIAQKPLRLQMDEDWDRPEHYNSRPICEIQYIILSLKIYTSFHIFHNLCMDNQVRDTGPGQPLF
jgi:hypothetical protein